MSSQSESGASRHARRVAVIGAGAAGLVAARELRCEGHDVTVLEQSEGVGGVWRYDSRTEAADPLGVDLDRPPAARVHSSMYANLRTNLPREIMAFSDFPFDAAFLGPRYSTDPRRFCSHQEVLGYLEAFADFYDLRPLVRTSTRVLEVLPAEEAPAEAGRVSEPAAGGERGWVVTSERLARRNGAAGCQGPGAAGGGGGGPTGLLQAGTRHRELYDAVVVCNGHYSDPRLPHLPGLPAGPGGRGGSGSGSGSGSAFPGQQLHSHNYRSPEQWRDKVVLLVGASNSGEDISRELSAGGARRVLLSARSWQHGAAGEGTEAPPYGPGGNIYRCAMVSELHADGSATFEDGRREAPIDAVIYCTGYRYSFPFLRGSAAAAARVADNCVGPLWLHLLPPGPLAPGLSFLGLPWKVVPFPQAELQSKLIARLLSGRADLPSRERMEADIAAHREAQRAAGLPSRYTHMQGMEQFAYNDLLVQMCGPDVQPLPAWREQLYAATSSLRRMRPEDYRDADLAAALGSSAAPIAAAADDAAAQMELITGSRSHSLSTVLEHGAQTSNR